MKSMDEDLIRKKPADLSKRQAKYVAARETGASKQRSAIMAGFSDTDKSGAHVENAPAVQEQLAIARAEFAKETGITKQAVLQGLMEAADMAKLLADPMAMVRAWSEIGKMMGHYAPEVKKHLHGLDKESRDALKALPDDQLHRLAKGTIIEGEFEEVKDGS